MFLLLNNLGEEEIIQFYKKKNRNNFIYFFL